MLSLTNVLDKPAFCSKCCYSSIGQGFAPDHVPNNPRIALLTDFCTESAMTLRQPLGNDGGRQFFHRFLEPVGFNLDNVIISSVLRCRPPEGAYPIGDLRRQAESMCRKWDCKHQKNCGDAVEILDGGLSSFNPNYFMISIDPIFVNRTWSITRVVEKDMQKASRLSEGRNLLILLGDKAMSLVCPELEGGLVKWRGHHGPLDWKKFEERFK